MTEYCEVTELSSQELHLIADHCNDKKTNAKRASELSNELYFSVFVKVIQQDLVIVLGKLVLVN